MSLPKRSPYQEQNIKFTKQETLFYWYCSDLVQNNYCQNPTSSLGNCHNILDKNLLFLTICQMYFAYMFTCLWKCVLFLFMLLTLNLLSDCWLNLNIYLVQVVERQRFIQYIYAIQIETICTSFHITFCSFCHLCRAIAICFGHIFLQPSICVSF